MPKEECRESRPVPFTAEGVAWAAVAAGAVRESVGVDVDAQGRLLPSPTRQTVVGLTPFQRQLPPFAAVGGPSNLSMSGAVWGSVQSVRSGVSLPPSAPPSRARSPLAEVNGNEVHVRVLGDEIRKLEVANQCLRKQVRVQEKLIVGFCEREVYRA